MGIRLFNGARFFWSLKEFSNLQLWNNTCLFFVVDTCFFLTDNGGETVEADFVDVDGEHSCSCCDEVGWRGSSLVEDGESWAGGVDDACTGEDVVIIGEEDNTLLPDIYNL